MEFLPLSFSALEQQISTELQICLYISPANRIKKKSKLICFWTSLFKIGFLSLLLLHELIAKTAKTASFSHLFSITRKMFTDRMD